VATQIKGRVGSLLEIGAGFHPELTGRENIYLNSAILGMKSDEIILKLDAPLFLQLGLPWPSLKYFKI
jgi:lipopolysaccharide transport system ATP-binding protein